MVRSFLKLGRKHYGASSSRERHALLPGRRLQSNLPRGSFFHIDITEVHTVEGKLYLFVGIDRTSKFAVTQLVDKADRKTAWEFLEYLLKVVRNCAIGTACLSFGLWPKTRV